VEQKSGANITCIDGPSRFRADARFRRIQMKKLLAILALSSALVATACNTVRGAGRDVQSAANAVDNEM
jgi:predicted small secreted protein